MAGWSGVGRMALLAAVVLPILLSSGGTASAESIALPPPSARIPRADDVFAGFVSEAAQRFGIPAVWIRAVMRVESGGNVRAVSPKGAMGLMQIMPETWATLRIQLGLGADPYDPRDNIMAGAAFLREMHDRYGSPGFLAAYDAGPTRYEEHLATDRALPAETQRYVAMLAPVIADGPSDGSMTAAALVPDPLAWTRAPLFIARTVSVDTSESENSATADRLSSDMQPDRTPMRRSVVDLSAIAPRSDGLFVRRNAAEERP